MPEETRKERLPLKQQPIGKLVTKLRRNECSPEDLENAGQALHLAFDFLWQLEMPYCYSPEGVVEVMDIMNLIAEGKVESSVKPAPNNRP